MSVLTRAQYLLCGFVLIALFLSALTIIQQTEEASAQACTATLYDGPNLTDELSYVYSGPVEQNLNGYNNRVDSIAVTCDVVVSENFNGGGWCYSLPRGEYDLPPNAMSYLKLPAKGCPYVDKQVTTGSWTALSQIGKGPNRPQSRCPYGVPGRGFNGTANAQSVYDFQLECGIPTQYAPVSGRYLESSGPGSSFTSSCGVGRVLAGATGWATDRQILALAPMCVRVNSSGDWISTPAPATRVGAQPGQTFTRLCPENQTVITAAVGQGSTLTGLTMSCSAMKRKVAPSDAIAATPRPRATATRVPTATPRPRATVTRVPTATPRPRATATRVPRPTATPRATSTRVPTATATRVPPATATRVPRPTFTPRPRPTATTRPRPTATTRPRPTATTRPRPTATPRPRPTATPRPRPTATPRPRPTATARPRPTATARPTATRVPTATPRPRPTATPRPRPTATRVPTATPRPAPVGRCFFDATVTITEADLTAGGTVRARIRVINLGDRPVESVQVRTRRPNPAQIAGFSVRDNPSGTTSGSARLPYSWSTAGSSSNPDGLVTMTGSITKNRYADVYVNVKVASTYVSGSSLSLNADVARGGCR